MISKSGSDPTSGKTGRIGKTAKTISEIISHLELHAPSETAEPWDNVGLLVGDPSNVTQGAVLSIDLTAESIDLALKKNFSLIVNHHPCLFPREKAPSRLTSGHLVFEAARKGISVAAYHTNFDQCSLEVLKEVAKGLGTEPQGRLFDRDSQALLKLVTMVPESHLDPVRLSICEAGAGTIGKYDFCTFGIQGEGTFRGNAFTQPFIGKIGHLEKVKEIRLETILPRRLKNRVLKALRKAHPYEEIAYDFYPVDQQSSGQGVHFGHGYGFWGDFPHSKPFSELMKNVKSLFNIHGFWVTRPVPERVSRVAFVAGKGASFLDSAIALGCDLFITGEVGYHNALSSQKRGMAVMELGHRESEKFFMNTMEVWFSRIGLKTETMNSPTQELIGESFSR